MKSVGIIPARGGSKGVKFKNIKQLANKPLIHFTLESAINSKIDKVIVSTDSNKIAKVAKNYPVDVIMRPAELAEDDTPILPVLQHAVKDLNNTYKTIILLQPTSPFRNAKHINEALELYSANTNSDGLVSIMEVPHNMDPFSIVNINANGFLKSFLDQDKMILRRQDKKKYFARNGPAILIRKRKDLGNKNLYSGKILPYKMGLFDSHDIDNENDFLIAESIHLLQKRGLY
tara:strand:+ start:1123 stop:1818 length:696 start_codon:yes stop_codon:yes gene_type:complete